MHNNMTHFHKHDLIYLSPLSAFCSIVFSINSVKSFIMLYLGSIGVGLVIGELGYNRSILQRNSRK